MAKRPRQLYKPEVLREQRQKLPDNLSFDIRCIDCRDGIKSLPDNSIDCVLTSPPYWQCRNYKVAGQVGLEDQYLWYIQVLADIFDLCKRPLKPTGSLWVNLGDMYSTGRDTDLPDKCLMLVPSRFAIEMTRRGWIVRDRIIWNKPDAMPEQVKNRFSRCDEDMYRFTKTQKDYFDLDKVRIPHTSADVTEAEQSDWRSGTRRGAGASAKVGDASDFAAATKAHRTLRQKRGSKYVGHPLGRNPGSVWHINTEQSSLAHAAPFPEDLCIRPILSSCPIGGTLLDPFCGTGVALKVGRMLGMHVIGFDLSPRFVRMSKQKVATVAAWQPALVNLPSEEELRPSKPKFEQLSILEGG